MSRTWASSATRPTALGHPGAGTIHIFTSSEPKAASRGSAPPVGLALGILGLERKLCRGAGVLGRDALANAATYTIGTNADSGPVQ